jgi:polysaccharide biosynthesis/export protein
MNASSNTTLKNWAVVALIPWFAGCASITPGMHVESKHSPGAPDPEITPIVKVVTPQLVQEERLARAQAPEPDLSALLTPVSPYKIARGDVLSFAVRNQPMFYMVGASATPVSSTGQGAAAGSDSSGSYGPAGTFTVDYEGLVYFPVLGGIKLAGLTELEARKLLISRLERYVKNPDVALKVQTYRSQRIYIDGEVKNPGIHTINDIPMSLMEAINRAGGVSANGDQSRVVVTRDKTSYTVDLPWLVQKGINPSNIMLRDSDIVRVMSREDNKVFVLGEVLQPMTLPMRNGHLTLRDALGQAGGINPISADGREVYVVRHAGESSPILYQLNARSPLAYALAEDFELQPKDVVYVDVGGLGAWNRVLNLILPSSGAAFGVYSATRVPR